MPADKVSFYNQISITNFLPGENGLLLYGTGGGYLQEDHSFCLMRRAPIEEHTSELQSPLQSRMPSSA